MKEFVRAAKKFCVAAGAACGVAVSLTVDNHVTLNEGFAIAVAFFGALGVYAVKNN